MLSVLEVGSQVRVIGFLCPVLGGVSLHGGGNTSVRWALPKCCLASPLGTLRFPHQKGDSGWVPQSPQPSPEAGSTHCPCACYGAKGSSRGARLSRRAGSCPLKGHEPCGRDRTRTSPTFTSPAAETKAGLGDLLFPGSAEAGRRG